MSQQPVCDECGQVHERCARHNRSGEPCRNYPKHGTTVCTAPTHGGRLPRVKAAAERNEAEAKARRVIEQLDPDALLGPQPVTDVLAALARLAGRVVVWEQLCAQRVAAMQEIRFTSEIGTEQLRAEVAVFSSALTECRQTLGMIARLDIDNRLARITEQQAAVVVRAVEAAITAAGVTGTAAAEARAVAARHLRAAS